MSRDEAYEHAQQNSIDASFDDFGAHNPNNNNIRKSKKQKKLSD